MNTCIMHAAITCVRCLRVVGRHNTEIIFAEALAHAKVNQVCHVTNWRAWQTLC